MQPQNRPRRLVDPPGQFAPEMAPWIWTLQDSRRRTRDFIEELAADPAANTVVDWVPPGGGNNIGTLLYHLVAIEMSYLYQDILEIGWTEDLAALLPYELRDGRGALVIVQGESVAQHRARLDAGRALLLDALREMTAGEFRRARVVEEVEVTPEWILAHLAQHEAEHRGQMGEIRRQAEQVVWR